MKERKEGKQENQQNQHYKKREDTLNKCPSRAAKTKKHAEKKGFFNFFDVD
jgi:hypothetical protein